MAHDAPVYRLALPVPAQDRATRLVGRRRSALRVRRCTIPESAEYDPIEDATVLVAGLGRAYPALTVAVGERMGLIGALSIDTARSYLGARDIDGVGSGAGFNRSMVEDFMEELRPDARC